MPRIVFDASVYPTDVPCVRTAEEIKSEVEFYRKHEIREVPDAEEIGTEVSSAEEVVRVYKATDHYDGEFGQRRIVTEYFERLDPEQAREEIKGLVAGAWAVLRGEIREFETVEETKRFQRGMQEDMDEARDLIRFANQARDVLE